MPRLKMYILVRDDVPVGNAMVAVAHASLAAYLAFRETQEVADWLAGSFRKVVCMVNAKEFANAKAVEDKLVLTESALDDREIAIAFKPRTVWPRMFNLLRLYNDTGVSRASATQE